MKGKKASVKLYGVLKASYTKTNKQCKASNNVSCIHINFNHV